MATAAAKAQRRQGKKALKEDKLVNFAYKAEQFYHLHQTRVLTAAGVVVGGVLIVFIVLQMMASSRQSETYDIALAKMSYGGKNYAAARSQFEAVVSKYSGDVVAEANYYLARIAFESGQIDEAEELFNKSLSAGSSNDNLTAASMAGLSASLETDGKYAEAAAKYEGIADSYPDIAYAPEALSQSNRLYLKLNQVDDQRRVLSKIVEAISSVQDLRKQNATSIY